MNASHMAGHMHASHMAGLRLLDLIDFSSIGNREKYSSMGSILTVRGPDFSWLFPDYDGMKRKPPGDKLSGWTFRIAAEPNKLWLIYHEDFGGRSHRAVLH
jgi:hypothetical protein